MGAQASTAGDNIAPARKQPTIGIIQWVKFAVKSAAYIVPMAYVYWFTTKVFEIHMGDKLDRCKSNSTVAQVAGCQHGVHMAQAGLNIAVFLTFAALSLMGLLIAVRVHLHVFDDSPKRYRSYRRAFVIAIIGAIAGIIYFAS